MDRKFRAGVMAGAVMLAACGTGANDARAVEHDAADAPPSDPATTLDPAGPPMFISLASHDGLLVEAGDIELRVKASACELVLEGLVTCDGDISLDVAVPAQARQTLRPSSIILKADALAYRGPLHVDARPEAHSFVISDVNADGHEDLLLWSGRDGAYGGPSFDVFLFDTTGLEFRFSRDFSDLATGYVGLFGVDGQHIKANAKSGCCIRVEETYLVNANVPELVERITIDSSPEGEPRTITERLIDGELRLIDP